MTARCWGGSVAALALVVATWHGVSSGVTPEALPTRPAPPPDRPASRGPASQGAGSCSATACHGSMTPADPVAFPSRVLRNEHTTWITQDPHAGAYQVLFSPRSRAMAAALSAGAIPAHKDARCLACHATGGTEPAHSGSEVVRQDGVSCESCHGAAGLWLGAHTQSWWNSLDASEKLAKFGMRATRTLEQRASVCVDCHVGSPGRDVNHDLIAAGHPRLNFEFAAFLANMPPHWVEDTRGNFPARAWAIGQVATARAGIDLLHERARIAVAGKGGQGTAPAWPEFAEYDCFACHHDLADEAWRKQRVQKGPPGTPPWGTWNYPWTQTLATGERGVDAADLDARFAAVRAEMNGFSPDPGKIAEKARGLSGVLTQWLLAMPGEAARYDAPRVKSLLKAVESKDPREVAPGWDGAAQRYLALQPLRMAMKGLDPAWADAPLKAELDALFGRLQFPKGFDSPRRFDPEAPRVDRSSR